MNQMTLSSRQTQDSKFDGLMTSMLPLGHRGFPQYWILIHEWTVDGGGGGGVRESGERVWQAVVIITTSRRYWNEIVEIHSSSLHLPVHVIYSGSNCKCHFPVSTLVEHWTFFSKLNLTKNRSVLCQSFVFWAIAVSICSGLTRQRDISLFKIPWSPRPRFRP